MSLNFGKATNQLGRAGHILSPMWTTCLNAPCGKEGSQPNICGCTTCIIILWFRAMRSPGVVGMPTYGLHLLSSIRSVYRASERKYVHP